MKVAEFIVSEDIRHEIGDKHTIVGVLPYNATLIAKKPKDKNISGHINIKLGFFIRIILDKDDKKPTNFSLLKILNGKIIEQNNSKIEIPDDVLLMNLAIISNFSVPELGELKFKLILSNAGENPLEYESNYNIMIKSA